MGFWPFGNPKRKGPQEVRPAIDAPTSTPASAPDPRDSRATRTIELLLRAGLPGGPTEDEARTLFGRLRSTPHEAHAVEELVRTTQTRPLPEALLVALAAALIDRGEPTTAETILAPAASSAALLMLGDLAERRGDIPTALARLERLLMRDLDYPGARERHQRWRSQLGYEIARKPAPSGATVVTREPEAPFDLLREIGRGGAAAVYEATDRELGRHVALKVYHHQRARDREQLAHEARVAVELEGPGVVRVFDLDPDHGWIALEWAIHGTLRDAIRAFDLGRLLPLERWALPLAVGLARVHAFGWTHHDVKPANVLLSRTGDGLLTDFGIARRIGEPSPAGSLGYLSPERMAGRASDPKDDIYAFGRVLEDVLQVVTEKSTNARFRPLALACTGPDAARPADGKALLTRLRVEILGI